MTQSEQDEIVQSERKKTDRLTDLGIRKQKKAGLYHDGRGLYLQVTAAGAKTWVFRYMLRGRAREMGLGRYSSKPEDVGLGLADARDKAKEASKLRRQGIDPIEHRKVEAKTKELEQAKSKTFAECFEDWIEAKKDGWRSEKYAQQQRTKMERYAIPIIGSMAVADIDTESVLRVLKPIWATKSVTARHVRDNIEAIIDYAKSHGYRTGENPAQWKGHLKNLLAQPKKLHKVKHRPALPYDKIGAFMAKLRTQKGRDADALEFLILTATRIGDITGQGDEDRPPMEWPHVDLNEKLWTIPATKNDEEHRVPLSDAAMAVIERVEKRIGRRTGLLFPSADSKSLARLRSRFGYGHITTHGFRSTFRDWAGERTDCPREIAEKALAHLVGDETERAYQRGDLLDKRRNLMDAWAKFCAQPVYDATIVKLHDNVVPFGKRRAKGAS